MTRKVLALALGLLCFAPTVAKAQNVAIRVTVCGTGSPSGPAGAPAPLTVDVNGILCSSSSGGGGGGTVTQGPPAATSSAWPVKVTDGTNVAAVKPASTAAAASDPAVVVTISPNSPLFPSSGTSPTADPGQALTIACQYNATPVSMLTTQTQAIRCLPTGTQMFDLTSVNGGVTPLTGAGATGAGSMRNTQAQDNTTIAGSAPGTAGVPSTQFLSVQGGTGMTPLAVSVASQYPVGAVPETASATGTTGATTATLAATAGKTTYICGLSIRVNATGAATGNATVTGTITGTLNFTQWTAPNASGLGINEQAFIPCIPASAANTTIAVNGAAAGVAGIESVSAWGYEL